MTTKARGPRRFNLSDLYADYRRFPVQTYRLRHTSPKLRGRPDGRRWWFAPVLGVIDGGYKPENYRSLGVRVEASGGRDWEGSCYAVTLAHFARVAGGGWEYAGANYPTLLAAVRAWQATT